MGSIGARRHRRTLLTVVFALALAGCAVAATTTSQHSAPRAAPNTTMSGRVSACVRVLHTRIRAFAYDGRRLPFDVTAGREPRCLGEKLRILRIAPLLVGGRPTLVRRGGCDRPAHGSRCARQPTAHVLVSDLGPVRLTPGYRNGNGDPVSPCDRLERNDPAAAGHAIDRMYYKRPSELPGRSASGARWSNYANPGRRFGPASSNYLLWNLPRTRSGVLPGGGIVEAVLAQREKLTLCDVPAVTLPSFDADGRRNGDVRFAYARVANPSQTIYGWVLRGYRYAGRAFTSTLSG